MTAPSKEECIAWLEHELMERNSYEIPAHWYEKLLEHLRASERWVPVSERLPANDRNVLVSVVGNCQEAYCEGVCWYDTDHDVLVGVDAWQEIPAPYEETP